MTIQERERIAELEAELQKLREENERLRASLWRIRMTAETSSSEDPAWSLPNQVIHLAEGAMGRNKRLAQSLAADRKGEAQ